MNIQEQLNIYQRENIEFRDSLKYASIIQNGILPKKRHFQRTFDDFFVLYKPLSYVSGDFYWIAENEKYKYIAVGDCTGHGVAGALLSMLSISDLNYLVLNKKLSDPSDILKAFDKKLIETFVSEEDNDIFQNDWVDLAFVRIEKQSNLLTFCGARRKLLIVSKNKSLIINGNRYPIGGWQIEDHRSFDVFYSQLNKGDIIYLGSDGYQDQIGGIKDKKIGSKRLHNMLIENSAFNCSKQREILSNTLDDWTKTADQIDDICILGIRI